MLQQKEEETLGSKPNFYTIKFSRWSLLAMEMKKTEILLNKPIYLGLSILDLNKTEMYEFWYDYV